MDWIFENRKLIKNNLYKGLNPRATLESPGKFLTLPMLQASPVKDSDIMSQGWVPSSEFFQSPPGDSIAQSGQRTTESAPSLLQQSPAFRRQLQ